MKKSEEELKLISEWMAFAKENLLTAKTIIKEDFSPYHTICYLCQNSSEKYLKAFMIYNGWELQYIHDLTKLLQLCLEFEPDFNKLKNQCILLNKFITTGRYPGDLPFDSITKADAEKAIEAADVIENFVTGKFKFL